jgi:hypothetical protein
MIAGNRAQSLKEPSTVLAKVEVNVEPTEFGDDGPGRKESG